MLRWNSVAEMHRDVQRDMPDKASEEEWVTYSPAMDVLVDRVLDEYGLIIAGWSGDWDTALRAAITHTPSRRFPFIGLRVVRCRSSAVIS